MKLYLEHYLSHINTGIIPDFENIERLPYIDFRKRRQEYYERKNENASNNINNLIILFIRIRIYNQYINFNIIN